MCCSSYSDVMLFFEDVLRKSMFDPIGFVSLDA